MTPGRIFAVVVIYAVACAGWAVLGTVTDQRSVSCAEVLGGEVLGLWGAPLVQTAPAFSVTLPGGGEARCLVPSGTKVRATLALDVRRRGLLWYPTFVCRFEGAWAVTNDEPVARTVRCHYGFPAERGTYDDFELAVDGHALVAPVDTARGVDELLELGPGQRRTVSVRYVTRGLGSWRYRPDPRAGRVRDLEVLVTTDFREVDYPLGCLSPMETRPVDGGLLLAWRAKDLITSQDVGVAAPEPLNPGPLAARITWFAPVCLIFFFVLVAALDVLKGLRVHPMHYLFVAAGFFAFHVLLVYLVDLVEVHTAFALSAATSVALVTAYLTAALGERFPARAAVAGQVFFLVLFSYSFFLEGATGLTVAVGSVVTLAVLMRVTAGVDWNRTFAARVVTGAGSAAGAAGAAGD